MRIGIAAVIIFLAVLAVGNGLAPEFSDQVAQLEDQELRDKNGRLLGKVRLRSGGSLEGRDASGRLRGTYDVAGIGLIPVFILAIVAQRYLVRGLTLGAIK